MLLGTSLLITVLAIFAIGILTGVGLGYGIAARFGSHFALTKVAVSKASNVRKIRRG